MRSVRLQVHTTGMDIDQLMNAHAALTLGKDMVFRDLAQGAFRMRGIAQGQTVTILVVPEIEQLMARQLSKAKLTADAAAAGAAPVVVMKRPASASLLPAPAVDLRAAPALHPRPRLVRNHARRMARCGLPAPP